METITTKPRPSTRNELLTWYREALENGRSQGLSVNAIADQLGVCRTTLYCWKRKVSKAAGAMEQGHAAGLVQVHLPRRLAKEDASATHVVLRLAGERSLEIPLGIDAEKLQCLIRVIEAC